MADRVTSCPHCSTSFRITDAQLQTAKGAVRCGSCLQIFRALDHLLPLEPQVTSARAVPEKPPALNALTTEKAQKLEIEKSTTTRSETPVSPLSGRILIHDDDDDILISDDMDADDSQSLHLGELSDSFRSQGSFGKHKGSLFDREIKIHDETEDDHSDESWAMDLLQELGESDDTDTQDQHNSDFSLSGFSLTDSEFDLEEAERQQEERIFRKISLGDELPDEFTRDTRSPSNKSPGLASRDTSSKDHSSRGHSSRDYSLSDTGSFAAIDDSTFSDTFDSELGEEFTSRKEPLFSLTGERDLISDNTEQEDSFGEELLSEDERHSVDDLYEDDLYENNLYENNLHEDGSHQDSPYDDDLLDSEEDINRPAERTVTDEEIYRMDDDFDPYADSNDTNYSDPNYIDPNYSDPNHKMLLQGIGRAPVEMEWLQEQSPWPKRILWGGLSLVACLGIVAQLAWFNFEEYSRSEPWREGYLAICPMIGCQVPSIADPRRVKAYNLVVRSNPRAENALIIDTILLNTASFEQPFPDFTLTFSNLQGRQLAHRRFSPKEYLGGEMAGANRMPSGQPVHISLEVLDPGPDAVNYTAAIPLD